MDTAGNQGAVSLQSGEPLTRYRIHSESSSSRVSKQYLRHLYSVVEFLLTVHSLTDNQRLTAAASAELLYNLNRIREIYAEEQAPGRLADSPDESRQPSGNGNGYSSEPSALELQAQVSSLQAQVVVLSERLATIRSSRVYRILVKVRNLLSAVRPTVTS